MNLKPILPSRHRLTGVYLAWVQLGDYITVAAWGYIIGATAWVLPPGGYSSILAVYCLGLQSWATACWLSLARGGWFEGR
jgi:CHASE2 domain-containing sensor protein